MPLPHLDGGPLLDIPEYEEITENDIYCVQYWQYNKKRIMYFDKSDNLYKCRGFKLTQEQAQEFKDYYSVIPFPHDEFTVTP